MPISRPSLTLGVEEEYLIVDRQTRDLATSPPPAFMAHCRDVLGDNVTHELLQAQIEIATPVCNDVGEVRRQLARARRAIARCAEPFGLAIIAASTHPSASWRDQKRVDMDRYRILSEDFQAVAERLVICGMHVHAGIEDDDLRIDLMDQATYFLPHLLAISTSSPFWEGRLTGLRAFRPTIFGDLPRTGIPERFASFAEWQQLIDEMNRTGICDDPSKIWWDMRPSIKQPTLELRICDICTRLEDAVSIAALYQSILLFLFDLRARNQTWRHYRPMLVAENKWRAQRYGVTDRLADFGRSALVPVPDLLAELIELVGEQARHLGCEDEVVRIGQIPIIGTSADMQIKIFQAARSAGADDAEARRQVIDWLIGETQAGTEAHAA